MIPSDVKQLFPRVYVEKNELSTIALANKMNEIIAAVKADITGLGNLHDALRCPAWLLEELGYYLHAGLENLDTEAVKRRKIATAIKGHKNGGTWQGSVKLIVDSIVGGDSNILSFVGFDDFIVCGKGNEPASYYWAGVGGKSAALPYGIYIYGKGIERGIKGVVSIDVDSSTLTAEEVEDLKAQLVNSIPSYEIIVLGYMSAGKFVVYANGVIK